jgi:FkbM family methyltransferase
MTMLRLHFKNALRRAGVYHRLKTSRIYELYSRICKKEWILSRDSERDFYLSFLAGLGPGQLIFDVGANEGSKTDLFLRMGARVIAIEPDETNQSILRQRFMRLRFVRKPLVIVGKAVSDRSMVETMWIDGPGSAVNTLSHKWAAALRTNKARHMHGHYGLEFTRQRAIETTTLDQLMSEFGAPIFIKIDVEGYEQNVIRGLSCPVPYLSFEVNLPEFRSEGLQCVEMLGKLAPHGAFNYAVDCKDGLSLDSWRSADQFMSVLQECSDNAIEVFWKTTTGEES